MVWEDHVIIRQYIKATTNLVLGRLLNATELDGLDIYVELRTQNQLER